MPTHALLHHRLPILFLLLAVLHLSPTTGRPSQAHAHNSNAEIQLRNMTTHDLDGVTTTFVDAFGPGVIWTYLYQFRDQFPAYHWKCRREEIERAMPKRRPSQGWLNVIVPGGEVSREARSVGGWKMMSRDEGAKEGEFEGEWEGGGLAAFMGLDASALADARSGREVRDGAGQMRLQDAGSLEAATGAEPDQHVNEIDLPCSLKLDMNLIRALHLAPQLQAAEKDFIDNAPYEHQLYLALLATHPDWDGHGFGAAQVEWGFRLARAEEKRLSMLMGRPVQVPVTLMATPAGYPLYLSLGFESVVNVTLSLLGPYGVPAGTTWMQYMRWFSDEEGGGA